MKATETTENTLDSILKTTGETFTPLDGINRAYSEMIKQFLLSADKKGLGLADSQCRERLMEITNRFQENAMLIGKMVYNSGKDVNDLGKFRECSTSKDTRYVVFSLNGLPMGIYLGLCGPIECTENDYNTLRPYLVTLGNKLLEYIKIDQAYFEKELTLDRFSFYDAQQRNADVHTLTAGHYVSLAFVLILIISLVAATVIEIRDLAQKAARERLGLEVQEQRPRTILQKYLKSFYLIENASKLFFARSKDGDPNLEVLNGVRVLSMLWVILGHTYYYAMQSALANLLIPLELFKSFSFNLVSSGPYAVDIFFWLSGFLGVYILLGTTHKRNGKMQNPLLIYLHRYLRLIPMYVLTLLFFWFLMSSVGSGPIFFMYWERQVSACFSTWWIHLIFLNNIAEINSQANECMGWTWYLPNDMQFFLLIPIIVFLLYKNKVMGLLFIAVFQAGCFAITIFSAYRNNMSPSYFEATEAYYRYYYHRPWARIAPFFVGVIVACALHAFKNERPEESRFKRIMDKVDSSKVVRYTMYVIGAGLFLLMIFIFYPINNHPDNFSQFFNVMFLTFSKALFVIGMSLLLLPAMMGHFTWLRKFLSLDFFTPLARLTFGAYMVHPTFMLFHALNTTRGEYLTRNTGIVMFICWVVVSFATSCICTLLIETPFMNLEKTFLMGGGKKQNPRRYSETKVKLLEEENGRTYSNGSRDREFHEIKKTSLNEEDDEGSFANDFTNDDTPSLVNVNKHNGN